MQDVSSFTGVTDAGWVTDLTDPPREPKSLATDLCFTQIVLSGSTAAVSVADFLRTSTVERIAIDTEVRDGRSSAFA